eukprot:gene10091-13563_t
MSCLLRITGAWTKAGVSSCVKVEGIHRKEDVILLDCGFYDTETLSAKIVLVSHGHMDHVGACISHARARALSASPATYYVPMHILEHLNNAKSAFEFMDGSPIPMNIVAVSPGDCISLTPRIKCVVIPTTHRVPSQGYALYSVLPKKTAVTNNSNDINIKEDISKITNVEYHTEISVDNFNYSNNVEKINTVTVQEIFQYSNKTTDIVTVANHDNNNLLQTPRKNKLLPEYQNFSSDQIRQLKKENPQIQLYETQTIVYEEILELVYTGDTTIEAIVNPTNSFILSAKILIIELTYLDGDINKAAQWGHIHLQDIINNYHLFNNDSIESIIFVHLSQKYSYSRAIELIRKQLPLDLLRKCKVNLKSFGANEVLTDLSDNQWQNNSNTQVGWGWSNITANHRNNNKMNYKNDSNSNQHYYRNQNNNDYISQNSQQSNNQTSTYNNYNNNSYNHNYHKYNSNNNQNKYSRNNSYNNMNNNNMNNNNNNNNNNNMNNNSK